MLCRWELYDLSLGTAHFLGGSDVSVNYTLVRLPLSKVFHQAKTHGSYYSLTTWGPVTFFPLPDIGSLSPIFQGPSTPPPAPQHAAEPSLSRRWMASFRKLSCHTFFQ